MGAGNTFILIDASSLNLIKALQQDDNAKIAASCAYLSNRRPQLIGIRASDQDGTVAIEWVNDAP